MDGIYWAGKGAGRTTMFRVEPFVVIPGYVRELFSRGPKSIPMLVGGSIATYEV